MKLKPIGQCEECKKAKESKVGFQFCEAHRKSMSEVRDRIMGAFDGLKITI